MKKIFTRIFVDNWKTTAAGVLLLFCAAGFWMGKLTFEQLLVAITTLGGAIGILSKDGTTSKGE